jgi:hypothetical protein
MVERQEREQWTIKSYKLLSLVPAGDYVAVYRHLPAEPGGAMTVTCEPLDFLACAVVTERLVSRTSGSTRRYDRVDSKEQYSQIVGVYIRDNGEQVICDEDSNYCGLFREGVGGDPGLVCTNCSPEFLREDDY